MSDLSNKWITRSDRGACNLERDKNYVKHYYCPGYMNESEVEDIIQTDGDF